MHSHFIAGIEELIVRQQRISGFPRVQIAVPLDATNRATHIHALCGVDVLAVAFDPSGASTGQASKTERVR